MRDNPFRTVLRKMDEHLRAVRRVVRRSNTANEAQPYLPRCLIFYSPGVFIADGDFLFESYRLNESRR